MAATPQITPVPTSLASRFGNVADLSVPLAVLGIVLAMIAPMPSFLLDVLISANITISVIVLLVSMYITRPVDFSVFPTALLLLTLFRLALNVSSTRLILIQGATGTRAAGQVIEAFGNFVVGGNYIIGVVIFLVMIAIQYVVINHGAVRISEVTARFTLDALPGKQMSIDSDLNAGLIDESEARQRRKQLVNEAEFYGAMDGASRFTQRDAIASILITAINIIAGFLIGVLQHGMDFRRLDRDARQLRLEAGHGLSQAGFRQSAAADAGERRTAGPGDVSGLAKNTVSAAGGGHGHFGLADAEACDRGQDRYRNQSGAGA